ncbi:MAG: hypothetical protein JO114_07765 [Planctomycetaceae bacterium]|nr:hypothetical protein [Planctomycetaceae bacterium]MBV8309113.1 hypothetical protein [Planctomycetaceae bacterium]
MRRPSVNRHGARLERANGHAAAGDGEAEAQSDAHIEVGGITHDALLENADRPEQHGQEEPVG